MMTWRCLAVVLACSILWGAALPAMAARAAEQDGQQPEDRAGAPAPGLTLQLRQSGGHGPYLVDGDGRALYLFSGDRQDGPETAGQSGCHDLCARHWIPVAIAGDGMLPNAPRPDLLALARRPDGLVQLTYNGWPLYFRAVDTGIDPAPPASLEEFGGRWSLVGPAGEPVGESRA